MTMTLKKVLSASLIAITCVTTVSSVGHASINSNSQSNPQASQPNLSELVATRVIVTGKSPDGQTYAKCTMSTVGRPDLVPGFAQAAPAGFESKVQLQTQGGSLPECDEETQRNLALSTDYQVMNGTKVAYAHLLLACVVGGTIGLVKSSPKAGAITGGVLGFAVGGFISGSSSMGPYFAFSVGAGLGGAVLGAGAAVACQFVGEGLAHYIFESPRR